MTDWRSSPIGRKRESRTPGAILMDGLYISDYQRRPRGRSRPTRHGFRWYRESTVDCPEGQSVLAHNCSEREVQTSYTGIPYDITSVSDSQRHVIGFSSIGTFPLSAGWQYIRKVFSEASSVRRGASVPGMKRRPVGWPFVCRFSWSKRTGPAGGDPSD